MISCSYHQNVFNFNFSNLPGDTDRDGDLDFTLRGDTLVRDGRDSSRPYLSLFDLCGFLSAMTLRTS